MAKIDRLVICSAWKAPDFHWIYDVDTDEYIKKTGRRSAGYVRIATGYDDADNPQSHEFIPIHTVNEIRKRVDKWRNNGYPGVTGITRELLNHWNDNKKRNEPLFFCQLEAIETIIWMSEANSSEKKILLWVATVECSVDTARKWQQGQVRRW